LVIDNKEHTLYKQYVFIKEKITIYVLNNYWQSIQYDIQCNSNQ
jgi:hypothetical protein